MKLERIVLMMLIGKLSLEEVEYKPFNEVCEYIRGITYNKSQEAKEENENNWKVLRANNIDLQRKVLDLRDVKEVDSSVKVKESQRLRKNDILICAGSGSKEHIGKVAFITEDMDYTFGGFMAVIRVTSEKINSRFLFHILAGNLFSEFLAKKLNVSTINNLNSALIKNFQIPLPPLPIQQEIVRILDTFTNLTAELTDKLNAELTARRKQYEYYRDELLTFGEERDEVVWQPLGEICNVVSGGTPSKKFSSYWENGTIKWLGSTVCKNEKTVDEVTKYITLEGLNSSSAKLMPVGTTLIALVGATIGKVAYLPFEAAINQNIAGIYPKDTKSIDSSYLYYACTRLYQEFLSLTQGQKLAMANLSFVRSLKIPVPPMDEQKRIAEFLDKFNAICSDLRVGLPAEITARQKQYEYYRDRLFIF